MTSVSPVRRKVYSDGGGCLVVSLSLRVVDSETKLRGGIFIGAARPERLDPVPSPMLWAPALRNQDLLALARAAQMRAR